MVHMLRTPVFVRCELLDPKSTAEDVEGFMYGSVRQWSRPLPRELDHPVKLGIGGIGRDTVSEGASQFRLG